jgi:hypothetical protein
MSPSPVNWGSCLRYPSAGMLLRGCGSTRGAYLAAVMTSISVIGGFAPAIGILGGGEPGGEGVREGATGNEPRSGVGNKRGFKENANELKSAGAPLCVGVGKSSMVVGLRQGTTSEKRGVTRISPSNPIPRGENSQNSGNGKLVREVYQETKGEKTEFLQKEMADYLFWRWKLLLQGLFVFCEPPLDRFQA